MSQKPLPDRETRLDVSKKLIAGARIPKAPPAGFNPLEASSDELKSYGLPSKPDATADPQRYAKWAKHLSKPLNFVAPTFKIVEDSRVPLPDSATKGDATATSGNWSGIVNTAPGTGSKYDLVEGEWIIPNAYPNSTKANGVYLAATWIGIDGWGSGDVLQAGTNSECVVSNGVTTSQSAFPWYEWYPSFWIAISNFPVHPGDTIWGEVYAESSTEGYIFLYNVGAGTYTSATFAAPSGTSLQGNSAEWIVEDPSTGSSEYLFPNYGSTAFFDCYAYSSAGSQTLTSGFPVNLVQNNVTLSEPIDEGTTSFVATYI
jgi:hypothetical protein